LATTGTHRFLASKGRIRPCTQSGRRKTNVIDLIKSKKIDLIINTPLGRQSHYDEKSIRRAATQYGVACITTLSGAAAAANAIRTLGREKLSVRTIQEYHENLKENGSTKALPMFPEAFYTLS
jgi:carbamoyl-phosphate synthase large subunit